MNGFIMFSIISIIVLLLISLVLFIMMRKYIYLLKNRKILKNIPFKFCKSEKIDIIVMLISFFSFLIFLIWYSIVFGFDKNLFILLLMFLSVLVLSVVWLYFNKYVYVVSLSQRKTYQNIRSDRSFSRIIMKINVVIILSMCLILLMISFFWGEIKFNNLQDIILPLSLVLLIIYIILKQKSNYQ